MLVNYLIQTIAVSAPKQRHDVCNVAITYVIMLTQFCEFTQNN